MLIGDRGGPRLRGRRVLVTGASGFIGRHLTARLVAGGAEVATLGRTAAGPQPLLPQHVADVGDSEAVMAALVASRPDVVVHLAGHVTGTRDASAVMPTAEANLIGTIHLLTAAVSSGLRPRIVLAGSMEEPDGAVGHAVPQSPYAAAKWASAGYVRMFEALYGLDVVHLRLFMTYGPGPQDERRLVPFVVRALLDGRRPQLSSGTRRVDWVYVGDVVDALVAAVVAERPGATPIDIGSGERESVRALVERIAKMLGRGDLVRFGEVEDRPMECEPQADLTMARLRLGWRPRTPLESGLRAVVAWSRSQARRESLLAWPMAVAALPI